MDIRIVRSEDLLVHEREELLALCREAYAEDLSGYLTAIGPGTHMLGCVDGRLVSQLIIVSRALQPDGYPPLRTGYIELVATLPSVQGRGYGSALLRAVPAQLQEFEIGGLSPSDSDFYARFGWERWLGPLSVRSDSGVESTLDEELMVLRLPRSPQSLDLSTGISVEWRQGEIW